MCLLRTRHQDGGALIDEGMECVHSERSLSSGSCLAGPCLASLVAQWMLQQPCSDASNTRNKPPQSPFFRCLPRSALCSSLRCQSPWRTAGGTLPQERTKCLNSYFYSVCVATATVQVFRRKPSNVFSAACVASVSACPVCSLCSDNPRATQFIQ